jgi:hypothetical protein
VLTICVHKPPKAISVQEPSEAEETVRRIEVKRKRTRAGELKGG